VDQLGFKTEGARFAGLDYWSGRLVPIRDGVVSAELPPAGCSILAVAPVLDRPQLLGSSRHITQCFVDVAEERWDSATLSGACQVVSRDATELRFLPESTKGTWKALAAEVSAADREAGVTATLKEEAGLVRVTLAAPQNRAVQWSVRFDPKPVLGGAPTGVDRSGFWAATRSE
jgi:hypothetical protein